MYRQWGFIFLPRAVYEKNLTSVLGLPWSWIQRHCLQYYYSQKRRELKKKPLKLLSSFYQFKVYQNVFTLLCSFFYYRITKFPHFFNQLLFATPDRLIRRFALENSFQKKFIISRIKKARFYSFVREFAAKSPVKVGKKGHRKYTNEQRREWMSFVHLLAHWSNWFSLVDDFRCFVHKIYLLSSTLSSSSAALVQHRMWTIFPFSHSFDGMRSVPQVLHSHNKLMHKKWIRMALE